MLGRSSPVCPVHIGITKDHHVAQAGRWLCGWPGSPCSGSERRPSACPLPRGTCARWSASLCSCPCTRAPLCSTGRWTADCTASWLLLIPWLHLQCHLHAWACAASCLKGWHVCAWSSSAAAMRRLAKTYGGVFRLSFGPKTFVVVSDAAAAKQVWPLCGQPAGARTATCIMLITPHVPVWSLWQCLCSWQAAGCCQRSIMLAWRTRFGACCAPMEITAMLLLVIGMQVSSPGAPSSHAPSAWHRC